MVWTNRGKVSPTVQRRQPIRHVRFVIGVSYGRTPRASPHFPVVPAVSLSSERAVTVALETSNTRVVLGRVDVWMDGAYFLGYLCRRAPI